MADANPNSKPSMVELEKGNGKLESADVRSTGSPYESFAEPPKLVRQLKNRHIAMIRCVYPMMTVACADNACTRNAVSVVLLVLVSSSAPPLLLPRVVRLDCSSVMPLSAQSATRSWYVRIAF